MKYELLYEILLSLHARTVKILFQDLCSHIYEKPHEKVKQIS